MTEIRLPPPNITGRIGRLLMLLFIFVSGGAFGAAGGGLWMRERMLAMLQHPDKLPDRIMPRIRVDLALSDEQVRDVDAIVRRHFAVMEAIRAESYPKQLAEFKAMRDEIAGLLSQNQRERWSSLCDSVEQRYLPVRPAGPPPADFIFDRFDVDKDGALSESEVPPGMWWRLRMADLDSDGRVTRDEYARAQADRSSDQ